MRRTLLLSLVPTGLAAAVLTMAPAWTGPRDPGRPLPGEPVLVGAASAASLTAAVAAGAALGDSSAGGAILTAVNIRPGFVSAPAQGQVTIANLGGPAQVGLQEPSVVFTCPASRTYPRPPPARPASGTGCVAGASPGYGQGDLAARIRLTVTDGTTGRLVFSGLLDGSGGTAPGAPSLAPAVPVCGLEVTRKQSCPAWDRAERHTFAFQLTFPDTRAATGRDNAYQGTTATVAFLWETL